MPSESRTFNLLAPHQEIMSSHLAAGGELEWLRGHFLNQSSESTRFGDHQAHCIA